ncbi:ABC transporter ATP-binding protein/permease [Lachnospiraceae bacterium ZAX-1]
MRKLLFYMRDYKKESILAPLFKMLEASFELLVPLVMAAVIDVGIVNADKMYIVKMCLFMVGLGIIGLICSITAQYYAAKAAVGFAAKLRHVLLSHIQNFSFTQIDEIGSSTMITRMTSDINQVQTGVNLVLRIFLRSPFIVFGAMIMAFTIDIAGAMVFVAAIPLLSIVVAMIIVISIPLYKKVQERLDKLLLITRENLSGVRVIRAFHKEEEEKKNFAVCNQELTHMQIHVGKITAYMNPLTYMMVNGALLALLYVGAVRIDAGRLSQGEIVALVNYMLQILVELIKLANLVVSVTKAVACGNRIQAILEIENRQDKERVLNYIMQGEQADTVNNMPQERQDDTVKNRFQRERYDGADTRFAVEFHNVALTYKNAGGEALSNINFKIKQGETVGIIGGTGSGKTSLVNLIPRFYDCTSGEVKVNGRNVKSYDKKQIRKKIGMVMQKAVLFEGSIRDNLKWGDMDAEDEKLNQALKTAQIDRIAGKREDRLGQKVVRGGENFSGGEKQRLTIARALVRCPEILILDDSASALDYATDAKLRKEIRETQEKTTVFIVSQRTSSIQGADKIIVLEDGKMAGIGTHPFLLKNCVVYKEIYESQYTPQPLV